MENELGRIQANARLDVLGRAGSSRPAGAVRSGSAAPSSFAGRSPGLYYPSSSRLAGARGLGAASSYLRGGSTPRSGGRYFISMRFSIVLLVQKKTFKKDISNYFPVVGHPVF